MDLIVIYMSSFQSVIRANTRSNCSHYTHHVNSIVAWMGFGIIINIVSNTLRESNNIVVQVQINPMCARC